MLIHVNKISDMSIQLQVQVTSLLEIHACSNPSFYFQTLGQHEVFRVISTMNAGSRCPRYVNYGNTINAFFLFFGKMALNS